LNAAVKKKEKKHFLGLSSKILSMERKKNTSTVPSNYSSVHKNKSTKENAQKSRHFNLTVFAISLYLLQTKSGIAIQKK